MGGEDAIWLSEAEMEQRKGGGGGEADDLGVEADV